MGARTVVCKEEIYPTCFGVLNGGNDSHPVLASGTDQGGPFGTVDDLGLIGEV